MSTIDSGHLRPLPAQRFGIRIKTARAGTPDANEIIDVEADDVGGLLTSIGDGTFEFDPNSEFEHLQHGEAEVVNFSYLARDVTGLEARAFAFIEITGINDAPNISENGGTNVNEGTSGAIISALSLAVSTAEQNWSTGRRKIGPLGA